MVAMVDCPMDMAIKGTPQLVRTSVKAILDLLPAALLTKLVLIPVVRFLFRLTLTIKTLRLSHLTLLCLKTTTV